MEETVDHPHTGILHQLCAIAAGYLQKQSVADIQIFLPVNGDKKNSMGPVSVKADVDIVSVYQLCSIDSWLAGAASPARS